MTETVCTRYNSIYANGRTPFGRKPSPYVNCVPNYLSHGRILDLGCGYGRDTLFLARYPDFEIDSVDISEEGILHLRKSLTDDHSGIVRAVTMDVTKYRPLYTYDCVIVSYLLHHLTTMDGIRLLARIKQMTNPNGLNIINAFTAEGDAYMINRTSKKDNFYPVPDTIRTFYLNWGIEFSTMELAIMNDLLPDGSHLVNERYSIMARNTAA